MSTAERVEALLGAKVVRAGSLAGGCVGDVRHFTLADGREVVAKLGTPADDSLSVEGAMLSYLASHSALPVPPVLHASNVLLLLGYVPGDGRRTDDGEADAARHIAALHGITAPVFGFAWPTRIGGLIQDNTESSSWLAFFRDRRLMAMARAAHDKAHLPGVLVGRIEKLCSRLAEWIDDGVRPSLIHGDLWHGNLIYDGGKVAAFIDPAIYFADPEIELAFATLFDSLGDAFFARYSELRPMRPGFFEERRDLYNLYPLLVHARLFGASYHGAIERTLKKFGA